MSGNIAVFAALVFPLGGFFYNVGSDIGKSLYGEGLYVIIFSLIGLAAGVMIGCLISWFAVSMTRKEDKAASEVLQNSLNALEERLYKEFNEKINALRIELQAQNFNSDSIPEIDIKESKPEESPEVKEIIKADKERQAKLAKAASATAAVTGTAVGLGTGAQLGLAMGVFGGPLGRAAGAAIGGLAGLIAGKFFGSEEE